MAKPRQTRIADGTQSFPGGGLAGYREMPAAQDDVIRNPDGVYSGNTRRSAMADGAHVLVSDLPTDPTTIFSGRRKRR